MVAPLLPQQVLVLLLLGQTPAAWAASLQASKAALLPQLLMALL